MKKLLTLFSACMIIFLMVSSVRGSGRPEDEIVNIDEKLFPVYLEVLRDTDAKVRRLAIMQLARYKNKEAIAPIAQLLKDDASEGVRREAAFRLGLLTYPESSRFLIETLNDDSQRVVRAAIRALGKMKSKEAIEPLKEKLKGDNEKDWEIQRAAAYALRDITGKDWSEGIHEVAPEYRVRDEDITFEAYKRAIHYFSRSLPAMIDTSITIEELVDSEGFFLGSTNRFIILSGYHLKQDVQLRKETLMQTMLSRKLGKMTSDDVEKDTEAYNQARKNYEDFLGSSAWAD